MGLIKQKGGLIHVWVPGVKTKTVKGKEGLYVSEAIDDTYEMAEYARSGEYAMVACDTFTRCTDSVARNIGNKDLSGSGTKRPGFTTNGGVTISQLTKQDYGMIGAVFEEWRANIWPAVAENTLVFLSGHEKLLAENDEMGTAVDAFGSLGTAGQVVMRNLPGMMMLLLRGYRGKKTKPGAPLPRILAAGDSAIWKAKDRLGVFEEEGVDVSVPKGDMSPEEHKEAIVETIVPLWDEWVKVALKRGVTGFIGMYSTPGWGKTLTIAALAVALYKVTGKPSLLCDWDCEGNAAVPEVLVAPQEEEG